MGISTGYANDMRLWGVLQVNLRLLRSLFNTMPSHSTERMFDCSRRMSRSTDFLSLWSIFLVSKSCTFSAVFLGAVSIAFRIKSCLIREIFSLVLFVVFGRMFSINIENKLAWGLIDFSFAWTAATLNLNKGVWDTKEDVIDGALASRP